MTAGKRIKAFRQLRGWSLDEMARRTKVQRMTLWRVENDVQQSTDNVTQSVAKALGLSMPEFWSGYLSTPAEGDEKGKKGVG